MARIKIDIPPTIIAEVLLPVRISDINYGNHLGNDALVSLLHEARVQWLSQLGYTELNIEHTGTIMSDLGIEYKQEVFYGDGLTIKIAVGEISTVSFELYYHVFNQHGKEVAKAKTGMVCYNYELKKIAAIPPEFLGIIQQ